MAAALAQDRRFLTDWNRHADFFSSKDSRFGDFQITPEYELSIGGAAQLNLAPATDSEAQRFVQQLVSRMAGASPAAVSPVTVTIYQGPQANAITVPGRMFVSEGLLGAVGSEAELAAIVSHELGHLYSHHAARRLLKAARGKSLLGLLTGSLLLGKLMPSAQPLGTTAGNIGLDLYLKVYDRGEEFEADRYATHVLYNAGFSPQSLGATLARLSQQPGIALFGTHPALRDRLKDLSYYIVDFPQRPAPDSPDFTRAIKKATPVIRADVPPPASALPPVVTPPASALPPVKRPPGND